MRAIKTENIWAKTCSACRKEYLAEDPFEWFYRDKTRPDGFSNKCRVCDNLRGRPRVLKYETNVRHNHPAIHSRRLVRRQTRKAFGPAKLQECWLCGGGASQWHHHEYHKDAIIPICNRCHVEEHK